MPTTLTAADLSAAFERTHRGDYPEETRVAAATWINSWGDNWREARPFDLPDSLQQCIVSYQGAMRETANPRLIVERLERSAVWADQNADKFEATAKDFANRKSWASAQDPDIAAGFKATSEANARCAVSERERADGFRKLAAEVAAGLRAQQVAA